MSANQIKELFEELKNINERLTKIEIIMVKFQGAKMLFNIMSGVVLLIAALFEIFR